jgi:hypothetical protein
MRKVRFFPSRIPSDAQRTRSMQEEGIFKINYISSTKLFSVYTMPILVQAVSYLRVT